MNSDPLLQYGAGSPSSELNSLGHLMVASKPKSKGTFRGPKYSVKYLGIVDGNMGILSRKMALPANHNNGGGSTLRAAGSSLMTVAPYLDNRRKKSLAVKQKA